MFKYVHENDRKAPRLLTVEEARTIWDSLIYLKLKCPNLDIKDHISKVESFIPKEDVAIPEIHVDAAEVNV